MKSRLLTTAAIIASLAAAPVLAQPDQQNDHHDRGGGQHDTGGGPRGGGGSHEMGGGAHSGGPAGPQGPGAMGAGAPHTTTAAPTTTQAHPNFTPAQGQGGGRDDRNGPNNQRHDDHSNNWNNQRHDDHNAWNGGHNDRHDMNGPNRPGQPGWNGGNNHGPTIGRGSVTARGSHFNFQGRSFNRVRGPQFRYPRGYGYRHWGVGARLPRLFLSPLYFFTDYASFGFGPPPYGEQWVRYGPDLLLVDVDSGEVVYVIYGAFY